MILNLLYIDPGSGSYLVQAVIAGILGALFFFKNAWLQVKLFFTGKSRKKEEEEQDKLDAEL